MWLLTRPLASDGGIGASDCELLRDAALAQPVNALTSLAYAVVGVAIVGDAVRHHRWVAESAVYGACLGGVALGSVLFHGPQPAGSRVAHDLPILITVIFIVVHDLAVVWPRLRHRWVPFAVGTAAATGLVLVDVDLGTAATGVGLGAIAVLELTIYRRRLRPVDTSRQRHAYLAIVVVAALAATSWLLGRTGSPACDPDATFQFHGLWHVISSLAFGLWWWLAFAAGDRADARAAPA